MFQAGDQTEGADKFIAAVKARGLRWGGDFSTADNPVSLTGTAPVAVQDIEINGNIYPVVWTDVRHWQVSLPLSSITNNLVVRGLDRHGSGHR